MWNITVLDPLVNGELAAIEQFADFLDIQVHGLSVLWFLHIHPGIGFGDCLAKAVDVGDLFLQVLESLQKLPYGRRKLLECKLVIHLYVLYHIAFQNIA